MPAYSENPRALLRALTLGGVLAALTTATGADPKPERGLRHRVDTLDTTVRRLADEVANIELMPGPPGEPGPPGVDPQRALAELLGLDPERYRVPDGALVRSDCSSGASMSLSVGDATLDEVVGFLGRESVSQPFHYAIAVRPSASFAVPADLLGNPATLTVTPVTGAGAVFSGIVIRVGLAAVDAVGTLLVVHLEPRLAALRLGNDFRARQDTDVPAIVERVLAENGAAPFMLRLVDSYGPRPYVVQYDESDLAFISRLMEEEGIFYYFTHEPGEHEMVIGDRNDAFATPAVLLPAPGESMPLPGTQRLSSFKVESAQQVARVTVRGWDPRVRELVVGVADNSAGVGESYHFDAAVHEAGRALRLAQIGLERAEVRRRPVAGTSNAASVRAGRGLGVTGGAGDRAYTVTSVTHSAVSNVPYETSECVAYANHFTAVPAGVPFRPPRITPKPLAHGPQTATVVATSNTEPGGRLKVRFHWNRAHPPEPGADVFIPVLVPAGTLPLLPDVGVEVLVGFMDGDPDRPLVLGTVPNSP